MSLSVTPSGLIWCEVHCVCCDEEAVIGSGVFGGIVLVGGSVPMPVVVIRQKTGTSSVAGKQNRRLKVLGVQSVRCNVWKHFGYLVSRYTEG